MIYIILYISGFLATYLLFKKLAKIDGIWDKGTFYVSIIFSILSWFAFIILLFIIAIFFIEKLIKKNISKEFKQKWNNYFNSDPPKYL